MLKPNQFYVRLRAYRALSAAILFSASFGATLILSGCTGHSPRPLTATPLVVVTTTTHLEDVVSIVAGQRVRVVGLIPRGGDPHSFEPSPAAAQQVSQADAVFINGLGLEGWLQKLVENAGGKRPIFNTSTGLNVKSHSHDSHENDSHRHGFASEDQDPHVWMDPLKMVRVVENVANDLSKLDPSGAPEFRQRARHYKWQLRDLDAWTVRRLKSIPPTHRKLVTDHDTLGYFAQRYGFTVVGTVIPSVATETSDTSVRQLATLRRQIEVSGVPALFAERSNDSKLIEQLGADADVRVVSDLYIDSLGPRGGEAGTYLQFFRTNVNKIAEALQ